MPRLMTHFMLDNEGRNERISLSMVAAYYLLQEMSILQIEYESTKNAKCNCMLLEIQQSIASQIEKAKKTWSTVSNLINNPLLIFPTKTFKIRNPNRYMCRYLICLLIIPQLAILCNSPMYFDIGHITPGIRPTLRCTGELQSTPQGMMLEIVKKMNHSWLGHVVRANGTPTNTILQGKVDGKRS